MGCCGSRESDSEDEVVTVSSVRSASNRGNSASSHHYSAPSRVNVAPSRGNIAPSRVNVAPSWGNIAPSRGNIAPSRVNVAPSWGNIAPSRGNIAPSRVNVAPSRGNTAPSRGNSAYTRVDVDSKYWHLDSYASLTGVDRLAIVPGNGIRPTSPTWGQYVSIQPHQPPADTSRDLVDAVGNSAQHNEERHFFHIFFSVLNHVPGHQGVLRRWEREDQRAQCESGGRCDMSRVWLEAAGYVKTLQRVKMLVYNKKFSASDRAKLDEWAAKVVKRRTKEYNKAKAQGKADPKHLKVLEEWRMVRKTIQELL